MKKYSMKQAIDQFLENKQLAIVGISSKKPKFGNLAYKELSKKGYELYPVHPKAKSIDEASCSKSLDSISVDIGGVFVSVKPDEAEKVVKSAHQAGIKNVWLQQGAESDAAIKFCKDNGMNVVYGECILMFAEPVGFLHKMHRGVWKLLGKYPK